ncbi:Cro/C1-type HTH DNA-binding domain-containing protein [Anaerobium acetethylicum]|uniref:Cro/C1-type HTH DNA-binding domain-containing protein n=2 Tax=Anaerobium acetethylicum TaxID=1619234 RepID=A0A1D3TV38_9FIRM|nr:Fic family protein [Anaerobium acetethylicum]SCP97974.1 Cro/C1-type HTH DNA-binding domain-containing protein [Anaerobium acetethylicum]
MGIRYDGLFIMLKENGITKTGLQKRLGLSSATMAKLSKNENVAMKVIEDICRELKCQPGDIMSMTSDSPPNKLLSVLKEEKEMKLKGGIYHQTQIKLAYNSNRIEGSMLSEDQTRYIYETNTIEVKADKPTKVDDIIETVNHFQCFDYMIDCAESELTESIMKEFHRILKSGTSDSRKDWFRVGDYKARPNVVGDMRTTAPAKVQGEIRKLLEEYNEKKSINIDDIIEFHYRFETIHPFQDGNGRVGRMILFKECLRHHIIPFIIDEEHKLYYYRGLKEYPNERGYLTDTCLSAQDRYRELMKYFFEEE